LEHWTFGSCSHSAGIDKYGTGLGLNTMHGKEAKHVQIASYARNSLFRERWNQVLGMILLANFGFLFNSHPS